VLSNVNQGGYWSSTSPIPAGEYPSPGFTVGASYDDLVRAPPAASRRLVPEGPRRTVDVAGPFRAGREHRLVVSARARDPSPCWALASPIRSVSGGYRDFNTMSYLVGAANCPDRGLSCSADPSAQRGGHRNSFEVPAHK